MSTYLMPSMQTPEELQAMADDLGLPLAFFKGFKFNPNHAPGGSPEGGQFTTGDGTTGAPGTGAKPVTGLRYDKEKKTWVHRDGTPVSEDIAARLKAAGVKPAYTEVELNPDPNASLQARGLDAKGRMQYMYSKEHSEAAAAEKFARLRDFNEQLPTVRSALATQLNDSNLSVQERDSIAVLSLIEQSGIRVGSEDETGGSVKAYGATTLLGQHVALGEDGMISLKFIGKSGKENTATIINRDLASYIAAKKLGPNDRVFSADERRVRITMKRIAGENFSPKDFRTWLGTATALREVQKLPIPTTKREYSSQRLSVGRSVAVRLNNTPMVALAAYIDPAVFKSWGAHP